MGSSQTRTVFARAWKIGGACAAISGVSADGPAGADIVRCGAMQSRDPLVEPGVPHRDRRVPLVSDVVREPRERVDGRHVRAHARRQQP